MSAKSSPRPSTEPDYKVVYEVDFEIDQSAADELEAWLPDHIAEILALEGFVAAVWYEREEPLPPPSRVAWTIEYRLEDRSSLDRYLAHHAARMRAETRERFGRHFTARRRIRLWWKTFT